VSDNIKEEMMLKIVQDIMQNSKDEKRIRQIKKYYSYNEM
jgi:hypothetical protein